MIRKILLLTPIVLLGISQSYCQDKGLMIYTQVLKLSDDPELGAAVRKCALFFNSTESIAVVNFDKTVQNGVEQINDSKFVVKTVTKDPNVVFKNLTARKIISREQAFRETVIVEDTLTNIQWEILPDKKQISTFNCRKAKAKVRGRSYTVWFTPDVPVSWGPWKLQGLPGLILEATDETEEVKFLFESLQMPSPTNYPIEAPIQKGKQRTIAAKDFLKITNENKEKMKKAMESRPGEAVIKVDLGKSKGIEVYDEK